jgi:hypothetical protein
MGGIRTMRDRKEDSRSRGGPGHLPIDSIWVIRNLSAEGNGRGGNQLFLWIRLA